jgi:hypothetical protein
MARAAYTNRRRMVMQIVIWLVFAASCVLAGGVAHWKIARMQVELGPSQRIDDVELRLPLGWKTEVARDRDAVSISCLEHLHGGGTGRHLVVARQHLDSETSATDMLAAIVGSAGVLESDDESAVQTIRVDGADGALVQFVAPVRSRGKVVGQQPRTAACAVLPGGIAVIIEAGGDDPGAAVLVRDVAASIHLNQPPHGSSPHATPHAGDAI